MKKIVGTLVVFCLFSCAAFHPVSTETQVSEADGYKKVTNTKANIESSTYWDFKFATNQKQFKKLHKKPAPFKNILVYGQTTDVPYDYYILYNPKKAVKNDQYVVKDTLIKGARFVIAVSAKAPESEVKFILNHISSAE